MQQKFKQKKTKREWEVRGGWKHRAGGALLVASVMAGAGAAIAQNASGPSANNTNVAPSEAPEDQQTVGVPTRNFDIPSQALPEAIEEYKKATGRKIKVRIPVDQLAGFRSNEVHGNFTDARAMHRLLETTGFDFTINGNVMEITIRNTEHVDVTGSVAQVSLPQFTESLTDTAQTVNVIPQYILKEQGAVSFRDSLKNAPGISLAAGEGGQQGDNLTIRGFSARNDIFLDGIRDFGSYFRDSFDYDSVDVIQGPASVEFGRGSTGGVVNQESKQPTANKFILPNLQFGTNGMRRGTLDMNVPLENIVPNSAFRINAVGMESGVAGRDITETRRLGVAPSLMFGLGRPTRYILQYMHQFENSTPDYGITWLDTQVSAVPTNTWYGLRNFNRMRLTPDVFTGRIEHDFNLHLSARAVVRYGRYPRQVKVTEAIANSTGTIAGVGPILNPSTAVTANRLYGSYTSQCAIVAAVASSCYGQNTPVTQAYLRRNNISRNSTDDILWGRTELNSHFNIHGMENNASILLEGGRERTVTGNLSYFNADGSAYTSYAPLVNPNPDDPTPAIITPNPPTHVASQSYGVNLMDTLRPIRWLSLSGGIRFDYFNTLSSPPTGGSTSRLDKKPTYRAAVVAKPTQNGSIYFDYGTSFNPSAESLSLSANNALLPPEVNETYETGVKWDLAHSKLNVNGSYFRTTKLNAKETDPNNSTNTILSGTQRVQGVQFGGLGHLPNHFDLIFGYAYLDSRVISSILNVSPFASVNLAFYNAWQEQLKTNSNTTIDARYNTAPYFISANGLPLTNVPKNTGNFWVTHSLPFRFTGGFGGNYVAARRSSSAAVNAVYTTQTATDIRNVPLGFRTVPGFATLNAMLSHSITDRIFLQVNFNNLTNKFYIEQPASNRLIPGERFNTQFSIFSRF